MTFFKKHFFKIAFIFIILIAISLRFFDLGSIPPGVNRDEAALGYNAYSLLETGKDEYGRSFPISFESFGDWKLPVYIYESIVPIKIFGLNPFSVRLPSALAGLISVVMVYFLVKELFSKKSLALLAMFLAAVSPWSLHLSRVASEANMADCFLIGGVLALLKARKKHTWLILVSAFLLSLTFGTYASSYVFVPLFALALLFIYGKKFITNRFGIIAMLIFISLGGFFWYQTTSANNVKISGIGIFGDPSIVNAKIETPRNEHQNPQDIFAKLFHNRVAFGIERFAQNYLNAFSPEFLFISGGGNHAHNISDFGNMYLVEAPFFFLGLAFLIFSPKRKEKYLILLWLLIAPIAPSITKDAPHTVRMFFVFPVNIILVALGIMWAVNIFKNKIRYIIIGIIILLYIGNIAIYLDRYYTHFPYNETQNWGLLYEKINSVISSPGNKNKKVIMSGVEESPYIYLLFYSSYDPALYQKTAKRYPQTDEGFVHVGSFRRFEFRDIDWGKDSQKPNTILIDKAENTPVDILNNPANTKITLSSGEPYFVISNNRK